MWRNNGNVEMPIGYIQCYTGTLYHNWANKIGE